MFGMSRVTPKGQVTIPIEMRRQLGIKEGDRIVFISKGNSIILANATIAAFKELQDAFEGEAERLGLNDVQDVVNMVKEIRSERSVNRSENNA